MLLGSFFPHHRCSSSSSGSLLVSPFQAIDKPELSGGGEKCHGCGGADDGVEIYAGPDEEGVREGENHKGCGSKTEG